MANNTTTPRLTESEMRLRAKTAIEDFVNGCHTKNNDDILLAISVLIEMSLSAGDAVHADRRVTLQ